MMTASPHSLGRFNERLVVLLISRITLAMHEYDQAPESWETPDAHMAKSRKTDLRMNKIGRGPSVWRWLCIVVCSHRRNEAVLAL